MAENPHDEKEYNWGELSTERSDFESDGEPSGTPDPQPSAVLPSLQENVPDPPNLRPGPPAQSPVQPAPVRPTGPTPPVARKVLDETSSIPKVSSSCHIGVLGPSASGKTYCFQGLVSRLESPGRYGVLSRFVPKNGVRLWECSEPGKEFGHLWNLREFNQRYKKWVDLGPTPPLNAYWYYLVLYTRAGWLGRRQSPIKLTFIDVAGEDYQKDFDLSNTDPKTPRGFRARIWRSYESARVMVFCLPLWVVFPGDTLSTQDWENREIMMEGFIAVLGNYQKLRAELQAKNAGRVPRTRIVLALTQADDSLCGTRKLRENWIDAYVNNNRNVLQRMANISGPTKYLADARAVSDYVRREFELATDQDVRDLPGELEIDGEKPWFIPMTAIDGAVLKAGSHRSFPPTPAHVELPVLLALCDAHNILM